MLDPQLRAAFERKWSADKDIADAAHDMYAADAVLEFPQSGERFEGVENFREWRAQYPADVTFSVRRLERWGDLVVAELLVTYDQDKTMFGVSLLELNSEDKVCRERIYIMEGWEAPEWRAPWRSDTLAT